MAKGYHLFDVEKLRAGIVAYDTDIRDEAVEALEETVKEAENDVRNVIYAAVTMTGELRHMTSGGYPGRVDSGKMVDAVGSDVQQINSDTYSGKFGWTKEFEDYFGYQEDGTRHIEGMDALGSSFIRAEDRLMDRMVKIVRYR